MRISFFILAVIVGCAMTQSAGKNYCNATGTFCGLCVTVGNNQSCTACGKMGVSTPVKDVAGTNECVNGNAANCVQAKDATTCAACKSGYAVDITTNLCVEDKTVIADCTGLSKNGTDITCQGCTNGKALSTDKKDCKTAVTDANCTSAMITVAPTQLCVACKSGFAKKGDMSANCDTAVSGDTAGCLVTDTDVKKCLFCNTSNGYWMSDVNKCTKYAPVISAAFALIASFFFWN